MLEIHRIDTLNSGNARVSSILHRGIVTIPWSHHSLALRSFPTLPNSSCHQAHIQGQVEPMVIQVIRSFAMHSISPKEDMVDLKRSPHSNLQDMGRHLQVATERHQHPLETIWSFGQPLPALQ